MRIKAYVGEKIPIYDMANGASESIGTIQANSFVTLTGVKKDGGDSYYTMDEYSGYIKKNTFKIIRDEEFFYASSLIKKKQNRSKTNRYNTMRKSIAANEASPYITPATSKPVPLTVGNGAGGSVSVGTPTANGSLIQPYDTNTIGVSAANAKQSGTTKGVTVSNPVTQQYKPANMQAAGSMMLSSLVTGGIKGAVNTGMNMNLGGIAGSVLGSTGGSLFNGATLSNLMDGSFFTGGFLNNALSLIGNILSTLLQKLDYVVGFNLSGSILSMINGFAKYQTNGPSFTVYGNSNYTPPRLRRENEDLDAHIRRYFRYKGSTGHLESKGPIIGSSLYDGINYSTPILSSNPNSSEVEIHKNLYNNLYTEFQDNINKVKKSMNLGITRNDWYYNFNRFRLIHPDSVLANSKGYIFFTRPDLNLASSSSETSEVGLLINNMCRTHPAIVAGLQKNPQMSGVSFDHAHKFIPILSNRCTGIDINDETLETKEVGDTYTGWKLNYGTNNIKSKAASTVTTSFLDDEQLSIYLMFKIWCEYISNVSRGIVTPRDEYVKTLQLDYANSIYYFLCAEDGQSILFWTKFTGCIPTNVPSSNFTDNYDTPIRMPKYSITWQYAFKKDYDPYSLAEFNRLANGGDFGAAPMYDPETIRSAVTIVGCPFVKEPKNNGDPYRLMFMKSENSFTS